MKIALISIWHNAKKHKKTQKTRLTKDSKIPLRNKIKFFSTCSGDFVTSDVLGFGKIKKKKREKMMRKNNNSVIYHSFKHYIVSLFITLLYEEFPQYIWTLAIY